MLWGHLVQVLHILLILAVAYFTTRTLNPWLGPVWLGSVVISSVPTGGMCPFTALSNMLLRGAGGEEYLNLFQWLEAFIGTPATFIFFIFSVATSFLAGYLVRRKKKTRNALN